jgi:hypothetical protein
VKTFEAWIGMIHVTLNFKRRCTIESMQCRLTVLVLWFY